MTIEFEPLLVPNFVRQKMPVRPLPEGQRPAPMWPIKDIDAESLARLCDEFRAELFRMAGKKDPKTL